MAWYSLYTCYLRLLLRAYVALVEGSVRDMRIVGSLSTVSLKVTSIAGVLVRLTAFFVLSGLIFASRSQETYFSPRMHTRLLKKSKHL